MFAGFCNLKRFESLRTANVKGFLGQAIRELDQHVIHAPNIQAPSLPPAQMLGFYDTQARMLALTRQP